MSPLSRPIPASAADLAHSTQSSASGRHTLQLSRALCCTASRWRHVCPTLTPPFCTSRPTSTCPVVLPPPEPVHPALCIFLLYGFVHCCGRAGTLVQIYKGATTHNPLPGLPSNAYIATSAFTADQTEQPLTGGFLLRMVAQIYHPGGAGKIALSGIQTGTKPWLYIDKQLLSSVNFDLPEGNHELNVRYA
jgi:hypothetical protein